MLKDRGKFYFMSRPRRFGKSLTISTYDCMFRGEKELFKDTWLYDNWAFEPQPVIRMNMSEIQAQDEQTVETSLFELMDEFYDTHGFKRDSQLLKTTFRRLIKRLYEKLHIFYTPEIFFQFLMTRIRIPFSFNFSLVPFVYPVFE